MSGRPLITQELSLTLLSVTRLSEFCLTRGFASPPCGRVCPCREGVFAGRLGKFRARIRPRCRNRHPLTAQLFPRLCEDCHGELLTEVLLIRNRSDESVTRSKQESSTPRSCTCRLPGSCLTRSAGTKWKAGSSSESTAAWMTRSTIREAREVFSKLGPEFHQEAVGISGAQQLAAAEIDPFVEVTHRNDVASRVHDDGISVIVIKNSKALRPQVRTRA